MNKEKVARELVRLAKELIGSDKVVINGKTFRWTDLLRNREGYDMLEAIYHEVPREFGPDIDWPDDVRKAKKEVDRVLHHIKWNYGGYSPEEVDRGFHELTKKLDKAIKVLRRAVQKNQ
jgi:hypothetical protein